MVKFSVDAFLLKEISQVRNDFSSIHRSALTLFTEIGRLETTGPSEAVLWVIIDTERMGAFVVAEKGSH